MRFLSFWAVLHIASAAYNNRAAKREINLSTITNVENIISTASNKRTINVNSKIVKRDYIENCNESQKAYLKKTILPLCSKLSDHAASTVRNDGNFRREYFKTDDETDIQTVQKIFREIEKRCDFVEHFTPMVCEEEGFHCKGQTVAYTSRDSSEISLCPYFFEVEDYTAAITLIHEFSHFRTIGPTKDHAYGSQDSKRLSKTLALDNADSYAYFALYASYNPVASQSSNGGSPRSSNGGSPRSYDGDNTSSDWNNISGVCDDGFWETSADGSKRFVRYGVPL